VKICIALIQNVDFIVVQAVLNHEHVFSFQNCNGLSNKLVVIQGSRRIVESTPFKVPLFF
jgi:hypothetical protein